MRVPRIPDPAPSSADIRSRESKRSVQNRADAAGITTRAAVRTTPTAGSAITMVAASRDVCSRSIDLVGILEEVPKRGSKQLTSSSLRNEKTIRLITIAAQPKVSASDRSMPAVLPSRSPSSPAAEPPLPERWIRPTSAIPAPNITPSTQAVAASFLIRDTRGNQATSAAATNALTSAPVPRATTERLFARRKAIQIPGKVECAIASASNARLRSNIRAPMIPQQVPSAVVPSKITRVLGEIIPVPCRFGCVGQPRQLHRGESGDHRRYASGFLS